MPRPSRKEEAKEVLRTYYTENGVMPTIEGFARAMGYRSTASAHKAVKALIEERYLGQEERGGRLLPGATFPRASSPGAAPAVSLRVPPEITASLPDGVSLTVYVVPNDSLLAEHAVCAGDSLVLVNLTRTDLSDLILQKRGSVLTIDRHLKSGWRAIGLLVAQFRTYRS